MEWRRRFSRSASFCAAAKQYRERPHSVTGWLLRKLGVCPWDYSDAPLNIDGLIRLDYAPAWFAVGLLFERNTCREVRQQYKKERESSRCTACED